MRGSRLASATLAAVLSSRVRGSTALMMATVQGWTEVMKRLVEWGVDADARDADGLTQRSNVSSVTAVVPD
jgi:hypothetical protein